MRPRSDLLLALVVAISSWNWCSAQGNNQWKANGLGNQYLNPAPPLFPAAPSTVSVGTSPTSGYALDVHGEQMNPPLGNVFKTDAPRKGKLLKPAPGMSKETCGEIPSE